jgi:hypothetical protein
MKSTRTAAHPAQMSIGDSIPLKRDKSWQLKTSLYKGRDALKKYTHEIDTTGRTPEHK